MKEIHVQITGIKDEDVFMKSEIDTSVNHFIQRIGELFKKCQPCEMSLNMVIKKHLKVGNKIKYSVHSKIQIPAGLVLAESHGFGKLLTIVQDCLSKLEGEIKKKHDMMISK